MENDASQFYHELDVSLKKYLSGKLNVPVEELTKKRINERMDKCNVGVGTTLFSTSLLEDIELNLYAPTSTQTKCSKCMKRQVKLVALLDKQICESISELIPNTSY